MHDGQLSGYTSAVRWMKASGVKGAKFASVRGRSVSKMPGIACLLCVVQTILGSALTAD
jgi:hypothetical protein